MGATYYWYGEDMTKFEAWYFPFTAITCYSSTDLSHWKFENNVVTSAISGYQTINHGCRPHVIYNQSTSTYVMWLRTHKVGSTYGECCGGELTVLTSSSPTGNFTYSNLDNPGNHLRGNYDFSLFADSDGTAYVLFTADDNAHLAIYKLDSQYKHAVQQTYFFGPAKEASTLARINGTYYLCFSQLTSWDNNDNGYYTATSLSGPWSEEKPLCPSGYHTYQSQTFELFPVTGTNTTTWVLQSHNWWDVNNNNLMVTKTNFLPVQLGPNNALNINWYDSLLIDMATGDVQDAKEKNGYMIVDQRSIGTTYTGSWTDNTFDNVRGLRRAVSNTAGSSVVFSFAGTGVKWFGSKNSGNGSADVYVDNVLKATVDQYSATAAEKQCLYTSDVLDGSAASHTLKIVAKGANNKNTDVDYFAYRKTISSTSAAKAAPGPHARANSVSVSRTGNAIKVRYIVAPALQSPNGAGDARQNISIAIYSSEGRLVHTLVNGSVGAGSYTIEARDALGAPMPSGAYICRMEGQGYIRSAVFAISR